MAPVAAFGGLLHGAMMVFAEGLKIRGIEPAMRRHGDRGYVVNIGCHDGFAGEGAHVAKRMRGEVLGAKLSPIRSVTAL